MNKCIQCGYEFSIKERFKSSGYLKCPKCHSRYRPKPNIWGCIYIFIIFFIMWRLWIPIRSNKLLDEILYITLSLILLKAYYLLPHCLHKYTKID